MDLGLDGKRALVTGASRGLGYATARALAKEGVHLVLNSRNNQKLAFAAKQLAEETKVKVIPFVGDVSDPDIPAALVKDSANALGGLDLLFTNSGGPPPGGPVSWWQPTWC